MGDVIKSGCKKCNGSGRIIISQPPGEVRWKKCQCRYRSNDTVEQIADKIIKELDEAGFTPDQMIEVIQMAREKYESIKIKNFEIKNNVGLVERTVREEIRYHIHGHFSTESKTKLEAIEKYESITAGASL